MRPELRSRLVFGISMSALVILAVCSDIQRHSHLGVLLLGVVGVVLGCREYARLARVHAPQVQLLPMIIVSVLLTIVGSQGAAIGQQLGTWLPGLGSDLGSPPVLAPLTALLLGLGMAWVMLNQMARHGAQDFFANVGATMLGMVYLGVVFQVLMQLVALDGSRAYYHSLTGFDGRGGLLVLVFLGSTKLGDVAAYFGGRAFGRHKMAPSISPGKTWEGFAFSFVGAIGGAYLMSWILSRFYPHGPFNGWWQPFVWGLVLGPFGVGGDLAESCMKRDAAMKDSGTAMGGFGGFLDIYDALVLAAPVAYVLALVL